jgi:N-acyl-D-amino-acid deacylase
VFDPGKIIDKATFENPHQFPEGIPYVVVNGVVVVRDAGQTDALPGKVIRKKQA